jgi:MULE transposase domain
MTQSSGVPALGQQPTPASTLPLITPHGTRCTSYRYANPEMGSLLLPHDLPMPDASPSSSSPSSLQSSSPLPDTSAVFPSPSDSPHPAESPPPSLTSADELTLTSVHEFYSYSDLHYFLEQYAQLRGFRLCWKAKGGEDKANHGGVARCWCYQRPPDTNQLDPINPVAQRKQGVRVSHRGKLRCNCPWLVCWNRTGSVRNQWKWHVTNKRHLQHNHDVQALTCEDALVIDSMRRVPHDMELLLSGLIRSGVTNEHILLRFTQHQLGAVIDGPTFHNIVNKIKSGLGVSVTDDEFKHLLVWLVEQLEKRAAIARFSASSEREIDRVFYMSADMVYNMNRNGCVLIMDSTHKTNRFNFPLLLVCGINEHSQTVLLAVALIHHQTTESFVWVLEQMKGATSPEAWGDISCIATDGDQAMDAAIEMMVPHARHLRCWYHLEQNLRHNLLSSLTVHFEEFLEEWKAVAGLEVEEDHLHRRAVLHKDYPAAVEYLEENIWKNAALFVRCYTKHICTLGILSTQRVEGMNAKLKGMLRVNCKTALLLLFDTLRYAASEIDRAAVEKMKQLDDEWQRHAYKETFPALTHQHISRYAQAKVQEQFDLAHNYRVTRAVREDANVFYVQRPTRNDVRREVKVTADSMECSCCFPATYLLPCRHVICLNQELMLTPFVPSQVGKRWLRSYKPPLGYKPDFPSNASQPSSSSSPVLPSFLVNQVQAGEIPARKRRYGELRGFLDTIASRGADDAEAFPRIRCRVQELCRWVEAETSAAPSTSAAVPTPLPLASMEQSSDDPTARLTSLHPTLTIADTREPVKPRRGKGREQERRQASQGERKKNGKGGDVGEVGGKATPGAGFSLTQQ